MTFVIKDFEFKQMYLCILSLLRLFTHFGVIVVHVASCNSPATILTALMLFVRSEELYLAC